ncbi:lectin C-type domain protein [Ostertagia ostertagi]
MEKVLMLPASSYAKISPKHPLDVNTNSADDDDYNEMLWIGGRQAGYLGWTWSDERPFSYTNWDHGEPNNKGGNEQCLQYDMLRNQVLYFRSMRDSSPGTASIPWMFNGLEFITGMEPTTEPKKWNDVSCDRKMRAFVCKK